MSNDFVFSWAQNSKGEMVHVDSVPRGLNCNCICPHCQEKLMARHGDIREHGFAHHSDNRGANLDICYMVVLYKLAEQIIKTKKKIRVPSYYQIIKENDIEFVDVKIDGRYERIDKQPDVIATTSDGKQFLIEFSFEYKVQHKKEIDYKNLNCIEIDLSNQTLDTVENFLLHETTDRTWLNNQEYFDSIEQRYKEANKIIKLKEESDCQSCVLWGTNLCSEVKQKNTCDPIVIKNSTKKYRICKIEQYEKNVESYQQKLKEEQLKQQAEQRKLFNESRYQYPFKQQHFGYESSLNKFEKPDWITTKKQDNDLNIDINISDVFNDGCTCFMCEINLDYMNKNDYAYCGAWKRLNVPRKTPPETAKTCRFFKLKEK